MTTKPDDELGFELPAAAPFSRVRVVIVLALVVGAGLAFGLLRNRARGGEPVAIEAKATRVEVFTPTVLSTDRAITLPGTVKPLEEATLYARVTGYVRSWKADIGDKVIAGQLLVEIDTPDVEAQLSQARAQLAAAQAAIKQASAQRDYSKSAAARYAGLADQRLVSQAQVEQIQAQAATDEANLASAHSNAAAAEANVRRLFDLQNFGKVTAPFAGTIISRSIDRGALVREAATPMFTLVATDPVRIFVDIPQSIVPSIRTGTAATVTVREYGSRTFPAKVTRAAGALDPDLHTMTIEVQVPNPDGALLPGMYVQSEISLPVPHRVIEIPSTALYNDAQGLRVATVDRAGIVHFAKIVIERDTGATLHVATGLTGEERVIKTAVPTLVDNDHVEVIVPEKK